MPGALPAVSPLILLVGLILVASVVGAWIWVFLRIAFEMPILPPRRTRVVPWGAGSVLVAILVWFGSSYGVGHLYRMASPEKFARIRATGGTPPPVDLMIASALSNAAALVLVPLALAATAGARRRDLGLVGPGLGRQAAQGVLAYPLLAPCVFGAMLLAVMVWTRTEHPLELAIKRDLGPGLAVVMVLAGAVLAPAAEELIFRGILLGWLTRVALGVKAPPRSLPDPIAGPPAEAPSPPPGDPALREADAEVDWNPYQAPTADLDPGPGPDEDQRDPPILQLLLANVAVSIVFAALHGAVWPTPIPIFFLSLGLGMLYQRTGGIVAPIALHMTFNGVSTLIMFLSVGMDAPKAPEAPNPIPPPTRVAPAAPKAAVAPSREKRGSAGQNFLTGRGRRGTLADPTETDFARVDGKSIPTPRSGSRPGRSKSLDLGMNPSDIRGTHAGYPGFAPVSMVEIPRSFRGASVR